MASQRIIFPLLFKKVTTFRGPTWFFDDGVYLETIYDEDYGAFERFGDEQYSAPICIQTKCIYIDDPAIGDDLNQFVKIAAAKLKFVLNNFSSGTPVALPYAALINTTGKVRILQIADIEAVANLHNLKSQTYKINSGNRETISTYYKVVSKSCENNPAVLFTLGRFNSCLTRVDLFDRIVDITISLESLISGTQELRYRFALYHSFIAESEADKRLLAFELLQDLYDARSAIVHGDVDSRDKKKTLIKVTDNWGEIMRLARTSINYYLLFLHEKGKSEWSEHQKNLVFAKEGRIVDVKG